MRYFFILGRTPDLSVLEIVNFANMSPALTRVSLPASPSLGGKLERSGRRGRRIKIANVARMSETVLTVETEKEIDISELMQKLGGVVKAGKIVDIQQIKADLTADFLEKNIDKEKKFYFGFSAYGQHLNIKTFKHKNRPSTELRPRKLKDLGLEVKKILKKRGVKSRFVTSKDAVLSSVVVKKNKLVSDCGIELVFMSGDGNDMIHDGCNIKHATDADVLIGETLAVQEFESFSLRDYGRPCRDMKVGMLPPKLARMMINISGTDNDKVILDPFCGGGTVLQELLLLGYKNIIGNDISKEMIDNTKANLAWLRHNANLQIKSKSTNSTNSTNDVNNEEIRKDPPAGEAGKRERRDGGEVDTMVNTIVNNDELIKVNNNDESSVINPIINSINNGINSSNYVTYTGYPLEYLDLPSAGDIVVADANGDAEVVKSYKPNANNIMGVVTTEPAVVLKNGANMKHETCNMTQDDGSESCYMLHASCNVALTGTVPIKVSLENGPIRKGDLLTTASIPGYAMAACGVRSCMRSAGIVGVAMQSFGEFDDEKIEKYRNKEIEGTDDEIANVNANFVDANGGANDDIGPSDQWLVTSDLNYGMGNIMFLDDEPIEVGVIKMLLTIHNGPVRLRVQEAEDGRVVRVIEYEEMANIMVQGEAEFMGVIKVVNAEFSGNVTIAGTMKIQNLEIGGAIVTEYWDLSGGEIMVGDAVAIVGADAVDNVWADSTEIEKYRNKEIEGTDDGDLDYSVTQLLDYSFRPAVGLVAAIELVTSHSSLATRDDDGGPSDQWIVTSDMSDMPEQVRAWILSGQYDKVRKVKVAIGGVVGGFADLIPGERYYLAERVTSHSSLATRDDVGVVDPSDELPVTSDQPSKSTSRAITSVAPTAPGTVAQALGIAKNQRELIINPSLIYTINANNIEHETRNTKPLDATRGRQETRDDDGPSGELPVTSGDSIYNVYEEWVSENADLVEELETVDTDDASDEEQETRDDGVPDDSLASPAGGSLMTNDSVETVETADDIVDTE